MSIYIKEYGITANGEVVKQYEIRNEKGAKAVFLDYGAILAELHIPDKNGILRDVVWGLADLSAYEKNPQYIGAVVGRNANRICGAAVSIGGTEYRLQKNNGAHNVHGGSPRYDQRLWSTKPVGENEIVFSLFSPDGDQGFPGNAEISVSYRFTDDNELQIAYEAKADQDTVINLTNHSYFNLEGQHSESVLEQEIWLDADAFTLTDEELIPTGEIRSVQDTPMDFRTFQALGRSIYEAYEPLKFARGYDHNYVLNNRGVYALCGKLRSLKTGILMEVFTDLPGIQIYTAQNLRENEGKYERIYSPYSAVCFETQYFPDAVHQKHFKSPILKKGEIYRTRTTYKFGIASESCA